MHELSICQGLLEQAEAVAASHQARGISRIHLLLGPLCGIEPALLEQAFVFARTGTVAGDATLTIDTLPIRVRCDRCGTESEALPNRLLCANCGDWHTKLVQGDEMLLSSLELELEEDHV